MLERKLQNKLIEELIQEILIIGNKTIRDAKKFDRGFNWAGRRIRRNMQIIRKQALDVRFEIQIKRRTRLPRTKHKRGLDWKSDHNKTKLENSK